MTQTKSWQFLGAICAIAVICVVGSHFFFALERGLAARIPHGVCFPLQTDLSNCYKLPHTLSTKLTTNIAVSPDGQTLAGSQRQVIHLWDVPRQKGVRSLRGHKDWVTALAFSPDGQLLASSSLDQTIKLWQLSTGKLLHTVYSGRMTCLQFSPDGKVLFAGSRIGQWADGLVSPSGIQRWDLATGKGLPTIGTDPVAVLAFSKRGTILASGLSNVQLWNVETGELRHTLDAGEVTSLVFSPDDQMLISASSRTKFWQVESGALIQAVKSSSTDLALSPDGHLLATSNGGTINFWQLETRKLVGSLRGSLYSSLSIKFGWGGKLISGSSDGIKVWQPIPVSSMHGRPLLAHFDRAIAEPGAH